MQAERRVAGKQRRNCRAIDMTHHGWTQRFGAGLVLAAGEERTVPDGVAGIGELQQHRITVVIEPADSDCAAGDAVHAVILLALGVDGFAGTIFAPPPPAGEQQARGLVEIVPIAPPPDVAYEAGLPLVPCAGLRHGPASIRSRPKHSFVLVVPKLAGMMTPPASAALTYRNLLPTYPQGSSAPDRSVRPPLTRYPIIAVGRGEAFAGDIEQN